MAVVALAVGMLVSATLPAAADKKEDQKAPGGLAARIKDLNLTEDQKTQIADFRKEYRPNVHEAGNRLRATVREEVDAILALLKG
jgi:Spy/CpxP family protein refolding chaperone